MAVRLVWLVDDPRQVRLLAANLPSFTTFAFRRFLVSDSFLQSISSERFALLYTLVQSEPLKPRTESLPTSVVSNAADLLRNLVRRLIDESVLRTLWRRFKCDSPLENSRMSLAKKPLKSLHILFLHVICTQREVENFHHCFRCVLAFNAVQYSSQYSQLSTQ